MSALALSGHASRAPQCLLSGESGHRSNIRKCPNDPHQTAESLLSRSAQGSFETCYAVILDLGANLQLLTQRAFLPSQMDSRSTMTLQRPRAGDFPLG